MYLSLLPANLSEINYKSTASSKDKPVADSVLSEQLLPFSQQLPQIFWDIHPCLFQNLNHFHFSDLEYSGR